MAQTVFTHNGFPKVGIRPIIDGRRRGVRESLEVQTMDMAKAAAKLISDNLRYPDGSKVECVIADTTIGGRFEAAMCANKFRDNNVGVSLSVTPCWCYGTETMDLDPQMPKAVWGFNGTERPGAVYLACMLAGYAQRGMPAYGIYGHEVQNRDESSKIPADVAEKIGIAPENMDECEILRRIEEGIYDKEEYKKAIAWMRKNLKEGKDYNPAKIQKSRAEKDKDWEFIAKMAIIVRDMMAGNPKLKEMGFGEEAVGRNAIAGGFQGQRQWTDHWPNGDVAEVMCNTSFDWNGKKMPQILATENDSLNGICMLLMWLLTNKASMFADVRTYWSDAAVKRATGKGLPKDAKAGIIHLLNSGSCCLDAAGEMKEKGKAVFKNWWDVTQKDIDATLKATKWVPAGVEYFRGGGADGAHQPRVAVHVVHAAAHRQGLLQGRLLGDERLGREPRRDRLRPHRRGPYHARLDAPHPGRDAQRARGQSLPAALLGALRRERRSDRRGLPRVRELRSALCDQPVGLSRCRFSRRSRHFRRRFQLWRRPRRRDWTLRPSCARSGRSRPASPSSRCASPRLRAR